MPLLLQLLLTKEDGEPGRPAAFVCIKESPGQWHSMLGHSERYYLAYAFALHGYCCPLICRTFLRIIHHT